jgi:hypothetical protein
MQQAPSIRQSAAADKDLGPLIFLASTVAYEGASAARSLRRQRCQRPGQPWDLNPISYAPVDAADNRKLRIAPATFSRRRHLSSNDRLTSRQNRARPNVRENGVKS